MTTVEREPHTSEVIITTALKLFSERTYEGVSIREIAAAVGVKPASLYNHYASKEDILWEIVCRTFAQLNTAQETAIASADGTVERFRAVVRAHTAFHTSYGNDAEITNRQFYNLNSERFRFVIEQRLQYEHALRDLVVRGVDEGYFRVPDAQVTTYAIIEIGMGVARWFRPGRRLDGDQLAKHHEMLALRLVGYTPDLSTSPLGDSATTFSAYGD